MSLIDKRKRIDEIDDELTRLFIERMSVSREIAQIKAQEALNVFQGERERQVIIGETDKMPDDLKVYGKQFYRTLIEAGKAYQSHFIKNNSKVADAVRRAVQGGLKPLPPSAGVACQGVYGSYAQIATDKMFELANITYFKDWNAVFSAVEKRLCRFGVLPIENSSVGSVSEVYDLMRKHNFYIVRSVRLRINHYLLAKKGAKLSDIKRVYSHEKAIGQCAEYLAKLGCEVVECENTAAAAKLVAEGESLDAACICSRECASIYGLGVLEADIADNKNNFTRFIAISKDLEIYEGANKISVMVNLPHEAGSLNGLLNRFSANSLNLTKIESRPIPESPFEFAFYFDFDADITRLNVQNLIADLDNWLDAFTFLGSYAEIG